MPNTLKYQTASLDNGLPTALVTGASSGIGVYYAHELIKKGYNVILVSNQAQEIQQTAAEIASQHECVDYSKSVAIWQKEGEEIVFTTEPEPTHKIWVMGIYQNLAQKDAAERLFNFYPNIKILVNNAGIFIFKDTTDCNMEQIEALLNLHIITLTKLCRLYGAQMKKQKEGYILNMSSISANTPFPGISLYTASKSYIRTFTKAFGYELKEYGIKTMVVSPGAVATNLYNLPLNLQRLGLQIGIIYPPSKLAKKGLAKLFRGKKEYIPGNINRFLSLVFTLIPGGIVGYLRRKTKRYMR